MRWLGLVTLLVACGAPAMPKGPPPEYEAEPEASVSASTSATPSATPAPVPEHS